MKGSPIKLLTHFQRPQIVLASRSSRASVKTNCSFQVHWIETKVNLRETVGRAATLFTTTVSQVSIRLIRILPESREAVGFAEAIERFLGRGAVLRPALPDL